MKKIIERILILLRYLFAIGIIVIIGYNAKSMKTLILDYSSRRGYFLPVTWIWILSVILIIFIIYCGYVCGLHNTKYFFPFIIFFISLIPRLYVFSKQLYIPTNDFKNYYDYGINLYYGNFDVIATTIERYQMPKMGGIAIFNYVLLKLFSPTLIGLQFGNVIITSMICVEIYFIIKDESKWAAVIAAILYAIYPSSIVTTQVTTNHHGATFLFLLSIIAYKGAIKRADWKGYLYVAIASILLVCSNFVHPSAIIILIAIVIVTLFSMILRKDERSTKKEETVFKRIKKCLKTPKTIYILFIVFSFIVLSDLGVESLYNKGIIRNKKEISIAFKVVLGLNETSRGRYNAEDTSMILRAPYEEQTKLCISIIRDRITNPKSLALLMAEKTIYMWGGVDGYFNWYRQGYNLKYEELENEDKLKYQTGNTMVNDVVSGVLWFDTLFLMVVYLFVSISLISTKVWKGGDVSYIMMLIALGWVCLIFFTEVQSRYRYPAMPSLMIIAGFSIEKMLRGIKRVQQSSFIQF